MGIVEFVIARLDETDAAVKEWAEKRVMATGADPLSYEVGRVETVNEIIGQRWGVRLNMSTFEREASTWLINDTLAKRLLLRRHEEDRHVPGQCSNCFDALGSHAAWPCHVVKLVAAPYVTHPEFDPAWSI